MAAPMDDVALVFAELGDLEKKFAEVELDALRRKEFSLKPLYTKRKEFLDRVPDFWPTVFGNGPEEIQQFLSPDDLALISAITSFTVERYQIESETSGEPRSLRFTFEFAENEFFEDTKLVKEFEYRPRGDGPGSLVSTPIPIKWKAKRRDVTHGFLDAAVELYNAEEALKLKNGETEVDIVERESLWQHEKLRDKLAKMDESPDLEPSFFDWFGFRGAVKTSYPKKVAENGANDTEDDDEEDEDDEPMLEVEIFPAGEEVAIVLAEELWTDAIDYFMSAQEGSSTSSEANDIIVDGDEESSEDDDPPELVEGEIATEVQEIEEEEAEADSARPRKRQRNV
ncbi:hypothetical protein A1O1_01964 [Capronia coronata CBS 617.96]|uniref:Uncharacterized protein n=1 Tax=Capronia coronata CBS 617.96 TaxID=1182541 RepID=W9YKY2_9EURO|nr:uncharacterized protein A1O1_01964 [Capronia coronata CBS 617.96]EXJ93572.1 hypothetical protein A1O1_01964 [Capronia coronata CBS 617.96]